MLPCEPKSYVAYIGEFFFFFFFSQDQAYTGMGGRVSERVKIEHIFFPPRNKMNHNFRKHPFN